jgi:hypothetical protein
MRTTAPTTPATSATAGPTTFWFGLAAAVAGPDGVAAAELDTALYDGVELYDTGGGETTTGEETAEV